MADPFVYVGGIDFSGAKEPLGNLWTAVGREEDGKLLILSVRPHAFRADLATFVTEGWRSAAGAGADEHILWGVNFACGVPAPAARHLVGESVDWRGLLAWVADRPADEIRNALPDELRTPRLTDTGVGVPPFDMRLYRQTVEGLRWLHELREEAQVSVAPHAVGSDPQTLLIEVSPAATTIDLGLPRRRAPGRPGEVRARAAALRTFLTFADPGCEALAVTLEDAWDATIGCLTAWLARDDLDQPFRVTHHSRDALQLEGWIYRPPAALG
jgi:hypothetical protein